MGAEAAGRGTRRRRWIIIAVVAFVLVGGGLLAAVVVASVLPTDPEAVASMHRPFSDRSGRRPGSGCGLLERRGESCGPLPPVRGYREEEVAFPAGVPERGLAELRGTVVLPDMDDAGPRPALLLVHGSGPQSRNAELPGDLVVQFDRPAAFFRELSRRFARMGLIVLRYDKRNCAACYPGAGHLATEEALAAFEWTDLIADAKAALDFLAARPDVDGRALVVVGHSEGGQLTPFIARGDDRVAAVMMLAASTDPFDRVLLDQLDRLAEVRRRQLDYLAGLNIDVQADEMRRCLDEIESGHYDPGRFCMFGVTQRALANYIELGRSTRAALRSLRCPIFAVQGTADINVHPDDARRILEWTRRQDVEAHYLEGMSHVMTRGTSPPDIDPRFMELARAFLESVHR